MRAGFARANVPIRPGFEGAIDHFLSTGQVWQGGALPNIGSKLFLPIATEIEEDLGKKKASEEKYGAPWIVRIPTSLVTLRSDDKLPEWKKQADGSWLPKGIDSRGNRIRKLKLALAAVVSVWTRLLDRSKSLVLLVLCVSLVHNEAYQPYR
jgi:hypothetical protein